MKLQDIAKMLEQIVRDAEELAAQKNGKAWEEKYNWLTNEIWREKENAEALMADMKGNGLTVGGIEAEGYLRCAITLSNTIERIEESYGDGT